MGKQETAQRSLAARTTLVGQERGHWSTITRGATNIMSVGGA